MVTRFMILVVVILFYCTAAFSQSREYWGAYVAGYTQDSEAYGVAWNYPSAREAIDRAVAECSKHRGYDCLVAITAFSTKAPFSRNSVNAYGYSDISVYRVRCVAIFNEDGDFTGLFGNSPREAERRKFRDARVVRSSIPKDIHCNAK